MGAFSVSDRTNSLIRTSWVRPDYEIEKSLGRQGAMRLHGRLAGEVWVYLGGIVEGVEGEAGGADPHGRRR